MFRLAILCAALCLGFATPAAELSAQAKTEVGHLLQHLEQSGCRFQRNGTWYDAAEARAHLEKKFTYLVEKGRIATAEDFIVGAATQSSMSGKPYQVQCGGGAVVSSQHWLEEALRRYRRSPR